MPSVSPTINLNRMTPAAESGQRNVSWQADSGTPRNVSAEFPNWGSVNPQAGATYTIDMTSRGNLVTFSHGPTVAVTLTAAATLGRNSSVASRTSGPEPSPSRRPLEPLTERPRWSWRPHRAH